MLALLDQDDLAPASGELARGQRAAGAAADHDGIDAQDRGDVAAVPHVQGRVGPAGRGGVGGRVDLRRMVRAAPAQEQQRLHGVQPDGAREGPGRGVQQRGPALRVEPAQPLPVTGQRCELQRPAGAADAGGGRGGHAPQQHRGGGAHLLGGRAAGLRWQQGCGQRLHAVSDRPGVD